MLDLRWSWGRGRRVCERGWRDGVVRGRLRATAGGRQEGGWGGGENEVDFVNDLSGSDIVCVAEELSKIE